MFEFVRQTMRLTALNVRRELAGKSAVDGRTASDLKLVVKGSNDLLDKLSPHLRGSFYMADVDAQGVLLPHALTKLIHPLLDTENLAYDFKGAGYTVTIDHAGNDESAIVLNDAQVNDLRLLLEDGGTVAITMRVQFHPHEGQLDPLASKLMQEVTVTMAAPKVDAKPKAPVDLFHGDANDAQDDAATQDRLDAERRDLEKDQREGTDHVEAAS